MDVPYITFWAAVVAVIGLLLIANFLVWSIALDRLLLLLSIMIDRR